MYPAWYGAPGQRGDLLDGMTPTTANADAPSQARAHAAIDEAHPAVGEF